MTACEGVTSWGIWSHFMHYGDMHFSLSLYIPSFSTHPRLFFLLYDSQGPHGRRNETFPCNRWEPERWYLGRWETESALVHCRVAALAGRQRL